MQRVATYWAKKRTKSFDKKIKYQKKKKQADKKIRINGKFVSKKQAISLIGIPKKKIQKALK